MVLIMTDVGHNQLYAHFKSSLWIWC